MDSLFIPDYSQQAFERLLVQEIFSRPAESLGSRGTAGRGSSRSHLDGLPELQLYHSKDFGEARVVELRDLLRLHDEAFLLTAYRTILGREPDAVGFHHFLSLLRSGRESKVRILFKIRHSAEGKHRGKNIRGLTLRMVLEVLFHIPLLGGVLHWMALLPRLPYLQERMDRIEVSTAAQFVETQGYLRHSFSQAQKDVLSLQGQVDKATRAVQEIPLLQAEVEQRSQQAELLLRRMEKQVQSLAVETKEIARLRAGASAAQEEIARIASALSDFGRRRESDNQELRRQHQRGIAEVSATISDLKVRWEAASNMWEGSRQELSRQREALAGHSSELRALQSAADAGKKRWESLEPEFAPALTQEMYVALESRFRGPRDLITERVREYLPFFEKARAGSKKRPILDLGCGRGELLEMLRGQGLLAHGLDSNPLLVAEVAGRGLPVTQGEILHYLRAQRPAQWGAITLIHVAEHLPFASLVELLRLAHRALLPGGLFLMETPNPQNLAVASHYFYLDPTHRRPIPGELTLFLLKETGFDSVVVHPIHPVPGDDPLRKENADVLLEHPMDYAAVGWKAEREP